MNHSFFYQKGNICGHIKCPIDLTLHMLVAEVNADLYSDADLNQTLNYVL